MSDRRSTPEAKLRAKRLMEELNARRHRLARCGAKARTTGEPCQRIVSKGRRCWFHGGRTPKGDGWHRPRWPNGKLPNAEAKLQRKLRDLDKRAKQKEKRMSKRSPEAIAEHRIWQAAHRPGSATKRAADRERRRQAKDAAGLFGELPPEGPPMSQAEIDETLVMIGKLRIILAERAQRRFLSGGVFD